MIGLGVIGLVKGDFGPGWEPVPESIPARQILAYLSDIVYLACGVGLLLQPITKLAACAVYRRSAVAACAEATVAGRRSTGIKMVARVLNLNYSGRCLMIYALLADDQDGHSPSFFAGGTGVRTEGHHLARLILLGLAHFSISKRPHRSFRR
ncbi:MAG: hypothetical protein R2682_05285 [Pyrinomonadaceae bacterium]